MIRAAVYDDRAAHQVTLRISSAGNRCRIGCTCLERAGQNYSVAIGWDDWGPADEAAWRGLPHIGGLPEGYPINGVALPDYCRAVGRECPHWEANGGHGCGDEPE
jgi:hypothetical protein